MTFIPVTAHHLSRNLLAICRGLAVSMALFSWLLAAPAMAAWSGPGFGPAGGSVVQSAGATIPAAAMAGAAEQEARPLEERRPKTFRAWLARDLQLLALAMGLGAIGLGVAVLAARKRK
jgi:hypothetical protein